LKQVSPRLSGRSDLPPSCTNAAARCTNSTGRPTPPLVPPPSRSRRNSRRWTRRPRLALPRMGQPFWSPHSGSPRAEERQLRSVGQPPRSPCPIFTAVSLLACFEDGSPLRNQVMRRRPAWPASALVWQPLRRLQDNASCPLPKDVQCRRSPVSSKTSDTCKVVDGAVTPPPGSTSTVHYKRSEGCPKEEDLLALNLCLHCTKNGTPSSPTGP
jgi:hypothetical protein